MKTVRLILIAIFALFSCNSLALSIVYDGFTCKDPTTSSEPTTTPIQSKFEVIEDLGGGVYRLKLTGGLPLLVYDNTTDVCISSGSAMGFYGKGESDAPLPIELQSIDVMGYFTGEELTIVVNSIYTDLIGGFDKNNSVVYTSGFTINSYTLILGYDQESSSFKLKKSLMNWGIIVADGSYEGAGYYAERIEPTVLQKVFTPSTTIEWFLR